MAVSRNWLNQRSFLQQTYNAEVEEWFADIAGSELDNSDPRVQTKKACFVEPTDSQNMALIKLMTFRYTVQQVHLRPDVYGIESIPFQENVSFRPQVTLFFTQDASAAVPDRRRIEGQISFRLVNETSATMTKAKAQNIAEAIRDAMVGTAPFVWKKGKYKLIYKDPEFGLNLNIMALNETEGLAVVQKMITIVGASYNSDLLRVSEPKKESETNPSGTVLVFEKQRKQRRWRPTGNVRFRYALLTIHGMQNRITLVDTTSAYLDALIWA
ncbi:hypothetical protein Xen7305DRAFT_00045480 [Xenococcus sp. PCC 7305]|uniref:hypothetical protein n=1 Tax=Xenococcus sp. PCC 7305 TaxID=102125 RepID=UPI0002AC4B54|nr:hypothetical protein [Xenococcus sp. PCC 7305]ELS04812.1 hypothetical protein Xen7305DRAFT_00045480 [Xenococcus sp. PCC 7305]